MSTEQTYLICCIHCNKQQQTIVRIGYPLGKRRKCVYCERGFTINKINLIRKVR